MYALIRSHDLVYNQQKKLVNLPHPIANTCGPNLACTAAPVIHTQYTVPNIEHSSVLLHQTITASNDVGNEGKVALPIYELFSNHTESRTNRVP